MLEILILFLGVILIVYTNVFWLSFLIFLILLALTLPGVYSLIWGAPFVISKASKVETILKLGNFKPTDKVVEPGCGDGRIIRKVAKLGVKEAIGYEFSLPTFYLAKWLTKRAKGSEKIYFKDLWKQDYSDADVLILFLMPNAMITFEKKIWPTLKSGARVISNEFPMKAVKPEQEIERVFLFVKK